MTAPDRRPRLQSVAERLHTDDRGGGKKAAWLPPLLLLLALSAALIIFLVVRNEGDDNDNDGLDVTNDEGAAGTINPDASVTTATTGQTTTLPSSSTPDDLSAGSQVLLPPPASGLSGVVGHPASGTAAVGSVVADEGFWVGQTPGERVFVHLDQEARGVSGESPFQVETGQQIKLEGTVTAAPAEPSSLGLTDAEGAAELTQLGGYVEATKIELNK